MQIRREAIIAITFTIAFGFLFCLLPYRVENMPDWFINLGFGICGLMMIGGILALTPIWDKLFKKKPISTPTPIIPDADYDNVYKIIQSEPSRKPPLFIDILLTFCGVVILAYGIWTMYVWGIGRMLSQFGSTNLLLFYLFFMIFPVVSFIDTFIIQRRQYRLGRSMVATRPKNISIRADIASVFSRTLQAINTMRGSIIAMDRPKLVRIQLKGSIMTVTTTNMGHGYTRVNFICDSQWITTKIDFGKNKRYANMFERLLLSNQSGQQEQALR